jgi:hypothetical protein
MSRVVLLVVLVAFLAGCGSSSAKQITIGAARTYVLTQVSPQRFAPGRPQELSFTIRQPSGSALTSFRKGPGPHTGVHVIIVRSDLGMIIHRHPPIGPGGRISETVTLPTPGRYRLVVDAYPAQSGPVPNFQLFRWLTVTGKPVSQPLPPFRPTVSVDGYRLTLQHVPKLKAISPAFLNLTITRADGRPAALTPWFGALAHAIFFRSGSLDYFHTHVCAPGISGCTSVLGTTRVTGRVTQPGHLRVGVLLPVGGTWRLFLQCKADGRVLTAPFTLSVA